MMLHHTTITKSDHSITILTGPNGSISARGTSDDDARRVLLIKVRGEIACPTPRGDSQQYQASLFGHPLAVGADREEALRKAMAVVSRILMVAQTDTAKRVPSRA